MNLFFLTSVFWIATPFIIAQDCNNPLLDVFNLTSLDKPTSIQGLPFCPELQNGTTCCSNSTVRGLQERLDNLTAAIQELAGDRDIHIAQLNENFTKRYEEVADSLRKRGDDVEKIQAINATIGDPIRIQYDSLNLIDEELHQIIYWGDQDDCSYRYFRKRHCILTSVKHDDNYKQFFVEYQIQRTVCLKKLLEVQASIYCLACNPNYASLGVRSDGSINRVESICKVIQENCAPMLYRAGRFNPIYQAEQSMQRLIDLTNYLNAFHDTDRTFIINVTYSGGVPHYTEPIQRTNSLPDGCNQTSCPWQCSNFFSPQFVMNKTVVANGGGIIGGADVYFPDIGVLQPSPEAGRLLQNTSAGVWDPELGTTGMEIVVDMDPAHVTNWDGSDYSDADINAHIGGGRVPGDVMSFLGLFVCLLSMLFL